MLELIYDNEGDIPEGFASLYTEKDGKWVLTGVKGMKTQADVDRASQAKQREVDAHKETKKKLAAFQDAFGELDEDGIHELADEVDGLRAGGKGLKEGSPEFEAAVEKAAARKTGPLERQITTLTREKTEAEQARDAAQAEIKTGKIKDAVREQLTALKVLPEAQEDALMYAERLFDVAEDGAIVTKDGVGVTPGLTAKDWLSDLKGKKPHWWPASEGAGSGGGGGRGGGSADNPWSKAGWNLTRQGAYIREHGEEAGARMAQAAGSKVGAMTPPEK